MWMPLGGFLSPPFSCPQVRSEPQALSHSHLMFRAWCLVDLMGTRFPRPGWVSLAISWLEAGGHTVSFWTLSLLHLDLES